MKLNVKIFILLVFLSNVCFAQFAGGSGTAEDPWLIKTPENLDSIRYFLGPDNDDKYFRQIADINLGIAPWNEGSGWEPIGRDSTFIEVFKGLYDGNGYNIMNLYINRPDENYIGLFGILYDTRELKGIFLQNAEVTGRNKIGCLTGLAYVVSINKCIVSGNIQGNSEVGGLIGDSKCVLILNSYNTASVSGIKNIGGLIGKAVPDVWNHIEKSYSTGLVTGTENTGGLFGYSENINVRLCYWNTETSGQLTSAGGEGRTTDEMTYDYSSNTYKYWDFENVWAEDFGNINNGYPFLRNQLSYLIPSAPANLKATGQNGNYSVELTWNNPDTSLNGDPLTELTAVHIYRNFDLIHTINSPLTGNTENYTDIVPVTGNYMYKVLAVNSEGYGVNARTNQPAGELFAWGAGTESDPYIISSAEELNNVRYYTKNDSVYFRQTDNIDLGVAPWNEGRGWEPIGDHENEFEGSFCGESRYIIISNLTINDSTKNYASLFGVVKNAEIDHVHLQGVDIKGLAGCGALAGASLNSTFTNCSSEFGTVQGYENDIGGLIGSSLSDSIYSCFSNCSVSGSVHIGGLIGFIWLNTQVSDCFSHGSVSGSDYVGGLIGLNNESGINNCYSTAYVTGESNTSGLAHGFSANIINSYWDMETSGQLTSGCGEGRMTADMTLPFSDSTYVDWDFENTWVMGWPTKYDDYPLLKWQTYVSIEQDNLMPEECKLFQNYPNPFNPSTEIRFSIPKTSEVDLSVYNVNGQKVAELIKAKLNSGNHSVNFNGSRFNSGIYYYSLSADGYSVTRKMIMLK